MPYTIKEGGRHILISLACEVLPDVFQWNVRQLRGEGIDAIPVHLPKLWALQRPGEVNSGRGDMVRSALHRENERGCGLGLDLEHVYKAV
jgi:hypothetical protein